MSEAFRTRYTQVDSEFDRWLDVLRREGVQRYLEIGSRWGGSLWKAANVLPRGARVVSCDSAKGMGGKKGPALDSLRACVAELRRNGYDAHFVKGHSQSASCISAVAKLGPFDAVFIDGDHEYAGVRMDWRVYGAMARIVAFHDMAWVKPQGYADGAKMVEVPRLWNEIKSGYRHEEYVDRSTGATMGIGVLWRQD